MVITIKTISATLPFAAAGVATSQGYDPFDYFTIICVILGLFAGSLIRLSSLVSDTTKNKDDIIRDLLASALASAMNVIGALVIIDIVVTFFDYQKVTLLALGVGALLALMGVRFWEGLSKSLIELVQRYLARK